MITLNINGKDNTLDIEEDMPLLWALRDVLNMTGTKFGCGVAACGACTVHVDGAPTRSCIMPVSLMAGKKIRTIEALEQDGKLHKVQQAWIQAQAPQCGYCQSGM
ncbi:MAG: 2Fe-2S iron-sulfur cluster-binding protein, partial [Burkholderiales bacterium]